MYLSINIRGFFSSQTTSCITFKCVSSLTVCTHLYKAGVIKKYTYGSEMKSTVNKYCHLLYLHRTTLYEDQSFGRTNTSHLSNYVTHENSM